MRLHRMTIEKRYLMVTMLLLLVTIGEARTVIYTSQIGGVAGLARYRHLSDCTVFFDMEEETNYTIVLTNAKNVTFDGMQTPLVCKTTLFRIDGGCSNIEICHFNAQAKRGYSPDFQCMTSANNEKARKNIHIHDNELRDFSMAISLGADNIKPGKGVSDSQIHDNRIIGTQGSTPGKGYGIHLANARGCEIYNNYIENTTRHAIYHAWGKDNHIRGNTIVHHRMPIDFSRESTGIIKGAIAIFRDSQNVLVENNTFIDNYSVSIHVYSFPDTSMKEEAHYADMHRIVIRNNHFVNHGIHTVSTGSSSIEADSSLEVDYPAIMIGFNTYNPYTSPHPFFIKDVTISGNRFENLNTNCQQCIRVYECAVLDISDNEFLFSHSPNLSRGKFWYIISLETDFKAYTSSKTNIVRNTIETQNTHSDIGVYVLNELANFNDYPRNRITVKDNKLVKQQGTDGLRYKLYYP